jgi:hypothetical protein
MNSIVWKGRERGSVRDRSGIVAGPVKWLVVSVRQKVTIFVPWFSCIRSFTTVYRKNTIIYDSILEKYGRLRFPYFAAFRRIRSRTYTIVIRSFTTVYRVSNCRPGQDRRRLPILKVSVSSPYLFLFFISFRFGQKQPASINIYCRKFALISMP